MLLVGTDTVLMSLSCRGEKTLSNSVQTVSLSSATDLLKTPVYITCQANKGLMNLLQKVNIHISCAFVFFWMTTMKIQFL